jgi:tRNA threonylcarbamoyladenosine biosynthesis protein TsaE
MASEPAEATGAGVWECDLGGAARTRTLGRRLGAALRGGEVILLDGPLGAGKTLLAGAIAQGLGVREPVNSPSYVILRSYASPRGLTLHHFDFYRLGGDEDLETIGLEDCLAPDAVVLVEWPSRCPHAFAELTLAIQLEIVGPTRRHMRTVAGALADGPSLLRLLRDAT